MNNKKFIPTVLVVEDEVSITETICLYLANADLQYKVCSHAEQARILIMNHSIDLVLLDIMLPGKDGFWLLKEIQLLKTDQNIPPVIMLTAKSTEDDIIKGLELGAIDYITKPFKPRELIARVNTQLRQKMNDKDNENKVFGQLQINESSMQVYLSGSLLKLTKTEYDLLYCLMKHPNTVMTRSQLISHVFGHLYNGNDRNLDTHLYNIRKKIEKIPQRPEYIHTIHGIGFKFHYLNSIQS